MKQRWQHCAFAEAERFRSSRRRIVARLGAGAAALARRPWTPVLVALTGLAAGCDRGGGGSGGGQGSTAGGGDSTAAARKSRPSFKSTDITGADYGRKVALADQAGRERTLEEFRGKVVLVFFGFTQCPDVCPTTLAKAAEVKRKLGGEGSNLQVLFVTLDPERDSAEVIAAYVGAFDPSFIGLRGDLAQTQATAREFRVFYQKVPNRDGTSYTIDHTAASYVIDPKGQLRLFVKHSQDAEEIVNDIRLLLV